MSFFERYYGKHKHKTPPVRQMRTDNRLCVRLSQDTWNEIDRFMEDNGLDNLSKVIEVLLSDSLLDYRIEKQKYELSDL